MSQREETYVARASEKLNYFFDLTKLMFLTINILNVNSKLLPAYNQKDPSFVACFAVLE